MKESRIRNAKGSRHARRRVATIAMLAVAVTCAHWWTPQGQEYLHAIHILLRRMYILPVVLAAIWFDLRAALLTACAVTLLYAPHIIWQWSGQLAENANQVGDIVTIWVIAVLSGVLVGREKDVLRQLAHAYGGIVKALVAALDMREHDTELHSLRVRAYTLRLSWELGVAPDQRQTYALAALLHDIGKIGVPDGVLLKPGKLDKTEWEYIKAHPALGRRILDSVPFLHEATRIVYAHHEKYDGTGYPQGLSGSNIPRGARIFSVADVFDALTSVRPYKKAMTYSETRREILQNRGTHFDPEVVDAFVRIDPEEWEKIRRDIERGGTDLEVLSEKEGETRG